MNTPAAAVPGPRDGAALAQLVGEALAHAQGHDGTEDAAEIRAITDAMVRLRIGAPLHSDGKLTIVSLAAEAGLLRNKLTHKHTGLKDLFYALVRARDPLPETVPESVRARADKQQDLTGSASNATICVARRSSWPGSSRSWRSRTTSSRRPTRIRAGSWPPREQSAT
ncbi:hypothetical protein ACH40E_08790 [Streptomyces acidicola]|uniref:hypothetical protein n=1 Tax=Streptomyces acidicola TaxID=2596892 RepID=UPI0037872CE5